MKLFQLVVRPVFSSGDALGGGWLSTLRALGVKWWCFFHSTYVTGFLGGEMAVAVEKSKEHDGNSVMVDTWLL